MIINCQSIKKRVKNEKQKEQLEKLQKTNHDALSNINPFVSNTSFQSPTRWGVDENLYEPSADLLDIDVELGVSQINNIAFGAFPVAATNAGNNSQQAEEIMHLAT